MAGTTDPSAFQRKDLTVREAIALIPARGGSKRIPRKNVRDFRGKPLIQWPLEAAFRSEIFSHVYVSTDDEEIAETARSLGAEVPFMRAPELGHDNTPTLAVVQDAIRRLALTDEAVNSICVLYPTSIFVTPEDLARGFKMVMSSSGHNFALSVVRSAQPVQRALRLDDSGSAQFMYPAMISASTQELEDSFFDAAQFYWGALQTWREGTGMQSAVGHVMERWRVCDIDNEEDWRLAEILHAAHFPSECC